MKKTVVVDGSKIIQKFNEALLEFFQAEGDLPDTISVLVEGQQKEVGQITIKKKVFEHPLRGD